MPSPSPDVFRIEVQVKPAFSDSRGNSALAELRGLGLAGLSKVRSVRGFALALPGGRAAAERIAREALADAVVDEATVLEADARPQAPAGFAHRIDIVKRKGVMDPAADGVLRAITALGEPVAGVRTYTAYLVAGTVSADKLADAAARALGNAAIEDIAVDAPHAIDPTTTGHGGAFTRVDVPLPGDDAQLLDVSKKGGLSLSLVEMQAIRKHFAELGRAPTDVELETIAQTWSEHCKHKTLAGAVNCDGRRYDNLLKETIFKATKDLARPWCISVFKDNAGVIAFDDRHHVTFKVETHNHPSAIEPYGGAGTGIGGVLRDTMGTGLGAKPIVSTDVFCFGPPDLPASEVPAGALHPRRVMKGVVAGVRDYGNRMGIPTANGALVFDRRFIGNPLVFCGSVGLLPADKVEKGARAGDRIVVVGGRTGRDGIHGATFSSRELHHESETLDSGAVQIGNAIQEKKVLDAQLQARDLGLYTCVTDCGAGGLSSAVGEMAEGLGAVVDLDRVPLKYDGLTYAEIWISEAQERMVLSVPPQHEAALLELFRREDVEATVIGTFTTSGRLELRYRGVEVGSLDLEFLHHGVPRVVRSATVKPGGEPEPTLADEVDLNATLERLFAQPDIASKEWVVHQYDHEVQAGSVIKPFVGPGQKTPSDAAVVRPKLDSFRGIAIGNGICPRVGDIDAYAMGLLAIDEAIRNVLAVGARFDECALLDNFCSASCERPEVLGAVVRVAEACRDAALAWQTPFISGKDSLNNEFRTQNGTVQIPTTILISSIALVVDVRHAVSSDFKRAGNAIVLLGLTRPELGGSAYYAMHGRLGRCPPRVDLVRAKAVFTALAKLTSERLVTSCHDLSDGGLAVALAEMAFSRGLGVDVDLAKVPAADGEEHAPSIERDDVLLFSESPTRFVLEIEPQRLRDVERILADVPHAVIGSVTGDGRVRATSLTGSRVLDADVQHLAHVFHHSLDLGSAMAQDAPRGHDKDSR
ncbi:MAG: phosphoribosylformylglycinamidine synthase subunit PurL [Planctomycetes bacterium]|nr:phosphoribosylformylglycinamidine synthase subunit PurL [Planctomycetota bacterium]